MVSDGVLLLDVAGAGTALGRTSDGRAVRTDVGRAAREDHPVAELARALAEHLVLFLRRPGGQSQFGVRNSIGTPAAPGLRRGGDAVVADPGGDHSLAPWPNVAHSVNVI
ncbi:hypothetical protein ACIBG0_13460 [Nocardia sp. NPDC050630]|uniref:hypothetical protein n=1 Tax=Nocardia sp. NPDC050630 TaxID=3364321 RepID=UPI003798057A